MTLPWRRMRKMMMTEEVLVMTSTKTRVIRRNRRRRIQEFDTKKNIEEQRSVEREHSVCSAPNLPLKNTLVKYRVFELSLSKVPSSNDGWVLSITFLLLPLGL